METTLISPVLLWLHSFVLFLQLWRVILDCPTLALSFCLWFLGSFAFILIHRYKVSLILLELLLNLGNISVCYTKRGDVKELHFLLNESMHRTVVLQHQYFLQIFDTQFCVQCMEQICQVMHVFISLLLQRRPLYVLILIARHEIILFLYEISEGISSGCRQIPRGLPIVLLVRVGFPPAVEMGGWL